MSEKKKHYAGTYAYENVIDMLKGAFVGEWVMLTGDEAAKMGLSKESHHVFEKGTGKDKVIFVIRLDRIKPKETTGRYQIVIERFNEEISEEPEYSMWINYSNILQQWFVVSNSFEAKKFEGFKSDFDNVIGCISFAFLDSEKKLDLINERHTKCKRSVEPKKKREGASVGFKTEKEAKEEADKLSKASGYVVNVIKLDDSDPQYEKGARFSLQIKGPKK